MAVIAFTWLTWCHFEQEADSVLIRLFTVTACRSSRIPSTKIAVHSSHSFVNFSCGLYNKDVARGLSGTPQCPADHQVPSRMLIVRRCRVRKIGNHRLFSSELLFVLSIVLMQSNVSGRSDAAAPTSAQVKVGVWMDIKETRWRILTKCHRPNTPTSHRVQLGLVDSFSF